MWKENSRQSVAFTQPPLQSQVIILPGRAWNGWFIRAPHLSATKHQDVYGFNHTHNAEQGGRGREHCVARQLPISHHKLERVSWHELLNIHYGELPPQLLLINLSQRAEGRGGGESSDLCVANKNHGILGPAFRLHVSLNGFMREQSGSWQISAEHMGIFPLEDKPST